MKKMTIKDVELKGKVVLIRVDFNVPMKDGVITDQNRIVQALPTIKYALEQEAKLVLFSHLGRVKEEADKAKNSLAPVAKRLAELLGQEVKFIPQTRGAELEAAVEKAEAEYQQYKKDVRAKGDEILKYIKNKDYKILLINDLETPSFELNSNLKEIKDTLSLIGNTIMSGSGSSMLVFVNNDEQLKEIIKVYPDFFVVDAYIL